MKDTVYKTTQIKLKMWSLILQESNKNAIINPFKHVRRGLKSSIYF